MKLFIVGATGNTGTHLVAQGLARGHEVTAFVRSPDKVTAKSPKLTIQAGDPTDPAQLAAALSGHQAVLSAIGARTLRRTDIHTRCARATIAAMDQLGLRRLVAVSTALLFPGGVLRAVLRQVAFNIVADQREMERLIQASHLDWTVLRPPRLLPGEAIGHYRVADEQLPSRGSTLRFADVAHFMIALAENGEHLQHVVGVCD